ncbi:DUF5134 domain-containing protein [Streptomyces ficellus]|uniref:DUF5134 domain-containing protein n=1 Tax=Streptomyces ficellus TaxID=1977088 RepID=A0ABT7Z070_9ACTN|nr:DUF5134 domain-containing protein [Streptomyces ficellus]MDN3292880.1 DUF5134 domain-containing protein [Streptomyces ficellus]
MHGSAVNGWLLVALCVMAGASCLVRRGSCAGDGRGAAADEAVMGFGMAAMAVPAAVVTPPSWGWTVYAVVFGVASLRALWCARRGGHHPHHLVGSLAMVYMAVAMSGAGGAGAGGHGTHSGVPLVTGALIAYYAVYVIRAGVRLVPVAAPAGGGWSAGPELALACRVSMGLAMLAMLPAV